MRPRPLLPLFLQPKPDEPDCDEYAEDEDNASRHSAEVRIGNEGEQNGCEADKDDELPAHLQLRELCSKGNDARFLRQPSS